MSDKKSKKQTEQRTGHIVSHTHWDREWRYTIWETRLWLIQFMDELVDVLESGKYKGFLMDGQVSPVLDYLEARPEMTDRIKKLVGDGKLQVGPWLTLPDEYPVDGEAMVRNLLIGRRKAMHLGQTFNAGYTSFGWGQVAQLPQIYAGFGMDIAFIGKRVRKERAPKSEFIWRAPDGTELLATRFGEMGRQNFYFRINLQGLYGLDHQTWDWEYDQKKHGILFHRADSEQMEQDHYRIDNPEELHLDTITPETAHKTWSSTDESVMDNDRLMMNGCDYAAAQPKIPEMIDRLREVDPDDQRQWVQATMPEFMEIMREKIDRSKLPVVDGELRDGPVGLLTGNAMTTRLYLKQLNKKAQNLLIRFAEPYSVLTAMHGAEWPGFMLDQAWDFLLSSHPHDSINGVTQDKTVRDVYNRLEQVVDIAQSLNNRSMQHLVTQIDYSQFDKEDILLTVFNPLPYPRRQVLEAWVTTPKQMSGQPVWNDDLGILQVYDTNGKALATQWEGAEEVDYCVAELHARILPYYSKRHRLFFETDEIPAMGYKVYRLGRNEQVRPDHTAWGDNQARTGSLLKAPHQMENEFLKVDMNPNGTFNLTDKENDRIFENLNYYEDRGEHGTYWINYRPMFQQTFSSMGCAARIWSEEQGPLQSTLISEITMPIPKKGNKAQQSRGEELWELTIRTSLTLRAGAKEVEVNVEFDNQHEDHYLRAMFPTGIVGADTAESGGHFYVDSRPVMAQGPKAESTWPDMATLPQNNFVDVSDGKQGIAFINDSLTEYEVLEDEQRTVALSLLRAVKTWIVTGHVGSDFPSQKEGHSKGVQKVRYALRPHQGNWQQANIPFHAERFNMPALPVQTNAHDGTLPAGQASLFAIDNNQLRLSALKKSQDRKTYIARVYNPTAESQQGQLIFRNELKKAWLTNLDEERQQEVSITESRKIVVDVAPYKIYTVEFEV